MLRSDSMKAIGIDIGTTSVCGVLFDLGCGKVIGSVTKNSEASLPGCAEWEKIQSVDKIMTCAKQILDSLVDCDTVSIGVTGQMHGILYFDKNGKAASPLYTWQDGRGNLPFGDSTYAKAVGSFSGYGNVTDFYNRKNGIRPDNAVGYCTIHDYFVMNICGLTAPVMHSSDAASLGCYDIVNNRFDYDCDISVVSDYHIAGRYRNIPVGVAIGDNQASVFSTLSDENNILVNVGTGSQISVISDNTVKEAGIETRPYFENKYLIVGAALCGGRAYSLLKSFYSDVFSYYKKLDDDEVYDIMAKMLSEADDGCLSVDTRFAGTRVDPSVSGSITGITTENFRAAQLTHGVLEGMAQELFSLYALMNCRKSGVIGSGNGIRKNPYLVATLEKKFSSQLLIPAHLEEAAFGAALFALICAGVLKNAEDAHRYITYNKGE